jgi:hypothetical protein
MRLASVSLFRLITCVAVYTLGTLRGSNTIAINGAQWSLEDPTAQAWHRPFSKPPSGVTKKGFKAGIDRIAQDAF